MNGGQYLFFCTSAGCVCVCVFFFFRGRSGVLTYLVQYRDFEKGTWYLFYWSRQNEILPFARNTINTNMLSIILVS